MVRKERSWDVPEVGVFLAADADGLESLLLSAAIAHDNPSPHLPAEAAEEGIRAPMPEEVTAPTIVGDRAEVLVADVDLAGVDFVEGAIRVRPPRGTHLPIHHSKA